MSEIVRQFTVAPDDDGVRLDRWFKRHMPLVGFAMVSRWARTGQIRVDGKRADVADRLVAGQTLRVPPGSDAPAAANWLRLQGPDRYADASTKAEVYQYGPRLTIVRSLDATTDAKANAYAANALRRRVVLDEQGSLSCPLDAGAELFDVLAITDSGLGLTARKARIIAISWRYTRGPTATKARYDATYKLGGL